MELKNHKVKLNELETSIPYYHLVGKDGGNKLFISAGIHGNEVNGIFAVQKIVEWIEAEQVEEHLKGELYIFPVLNPSGVRAATRVVPEDGKDLNRQFGENLEEIDETFSEVIAHSLVENFLGKCNMGIDFHDAGDGAILIPHTRIHKNDADKCVSCSRELARYFGTQYIVERDGDMKMMAVALNNKYKVPVITVEIGGAQMIYPDTESVALRGIKNVLVANSMYPGKMDVPDKQYVIERRIGIRSANPSILQLDVKLGDMVKRGDRIGWRYVVGEGYGSGTTGGTGDGGSTGSADGPTSESRSPNSKRSEILAPEDGVIFSIWPNNLVPADRTFLSVVDIGCDNPEEKGIVELEDLVVWEYNG